MARPLIKKDQKGVLYVRPPSIEAKIDGALSQDWETLLKRAKITDSNAPGLPAAGMSGPSDPRGNPPQ